MERLKRARDRYSALDAWRADLAIAGLFVLGWGVELLLIHVPDGESRLVTFAVGVVAIGSVALRRRDPLFAAVLFSGVAIAQEALPNSYFLDITTTPFAVLILLAFTAGRHASGRRTIAAGAVLFFGLNLAILLSDIDLEATAVPFAAFFVIAPALVGRGYRNRARLAAEQREKMAEAERIGRLEAERAVEVERNRIAAELQAVIANNVSAIVVQAESVPGSIAGGEIGRAGDALTVIEETGRDALAEMRRLLGVLRRDEDEGALRAPQPSLARADALAAEARERGLEVQLEYEGGGRALAPGVDLSAYRTLEAAFDGALAAGAGSARARIRFVDGDVELSVIDDRPAGGAEDPGLDVLRSRLQIYGGHLTTTHGGPAHELRAILPREPR